MSKAYLCHAEPGAETDCKHLRSFGECATGDGSCHYEPWPKRRSFWCWIRCHRMYVAGFKYHFGAEREGGADPIKVCQCKFNDAGVPTYAEQLREWRRHVHNSRSV